MTAIFREMVLTWHGTEYRVKPTMALLNRIEQEVSLSRLASRISTGDVPLTHLASVIAHFLRAAGARATSEDVYLAIMSGDENTVSSMTSAVMLAVFPQSKNSEAPPAKAITEAPASTSPNESQK